MQIAAPCVSVFCCSCVCGSLNIPANFSSFFLSTHLAAALPREAGLGCMQCSWHVQCADGKRGTRCPATDARCGVGQTAAETKAALELRPLSKPRRLHCMPCWFTFAHQYTADSLFGWLVREEVLLAGLCERKILFRLKIYDRLRQATAKRTGWLGGNEPFKLPPLYCVLLYRVELLIRYIRKRVSS